MSEKSFDEQMTALNNRIQRLQQFLPPAEPAPPPQSPRDPLGAVRFILVFLVVVIGLMLIQDTVAICFQPDYDIVFVAVEADGFHVWQNVRDYEAATGKHWIDQPVGDTTLSAPFHNAARTRAFTSAVAHGLLLTLLAVALRNLKAGMMPTGAKGPASSTT